MAGVKSRLGQHGFALSTGAGAGLSHLMSFAGSNVISPAAVLWRAAPDLSAVPGGDLATGDRLVLFARPRNYEGVTQNR